MTTQLQLISPEYRDLQAAFHESRPDYGISSRAHVDTILSLAKALNTRDILDYGCGKACLQKGMPYPIQNYDPCMPEYTRRPNPADLVVCTDVLEHIEEPCLANVLDDLKVLTLRVLFLNVACRPASKFLPDGRNAHLIVESPNWWLIHLLPCFSLQAFQTTPACDSFTAILVPHPQCQTTEPTNDLHPR